MSLKEGTERWGSGLNPWSIAIAITMSGLEFVILLPQSTRSRLQTSNAVLDSEVSFCFPSVMPKFEIFMI